MTQSSGGSTPPKLDLGNRPPRCAPGDLSPSGYFHQRPARLSHASSLQSFGESRRPGGHFTRTLETCAPGHRLSPQNQPMLDAFGLRVVERWQVGDRRRFGFVQDALGHRLEGGPARPVERGGFADLPQQAAPFDDDAVDVAGGDGLITSGGVTCGGSGAFGDGISGCAGCCACGGSGII